MQVDIQKALSLMQDIIKSDVNEVSNLREALIQRDEAIAGYQGKIEDFQDEIRKLKEALETVREDTQMLLDTECEFSHENLSATIATIDRALGKG